MKKFLSFLFLLFYLHAAKACANYYYSVDKEGQLHLAEDIRKPFNINFNKERNVSKLKKLESKLKKEHTYMLLSDYAVGLMNLGKYKESLAILKELYLHYPNEYKIASNLGTAYELNGNTEMALKYIRRGLELNPNDHDGSEWIHVKVLETKLILLKNPVYLEKKTVLQLSEKQEKDVEVCRQISLQVRERFPFTPGPDAIMASLLTDLGDCYANTASVEYARAVYEIANQYYGDKSPELLMKIKLMKTLTRQYFSVEPDRSTVKKLQEGRVVEEGEHRKISGFFSYKTLLDNNDDNNYQIDWSKINTDINVLLALVDLTKTVTEIENSASKEKEDSSGLKWIREYSDSIKDTAVLLQKEKNNTESKSTNSSLQWILSILGASFCVWWMSRCFYDRSKIKSGN